MKYRHVFLLSSANQHGYLFVDSLLNKYGVNREEIALFFYDNKSREGLIFPNTLLDLRIYFMSDPHAPEVIRDADTVTINSLQPENAKVAVDLQKSGYLAYEKLYIRITDDEVDRWNKNYQDNGVLTESAESLIDENVLEVLSIVKNFICLDRPWGRLLKSVTGRKLNIISAVPFAHVIPDQASYEFFDEIVRKSIVRQMTNESIVRVLFFTKSKPIRDSIVILKQLIKELLFMKRQFRKKSIEFLVWKKSRIKNPLLCLLEFLCLILARLKGIKISFIEVSSLPKESYLLMLYRCHYLIFQKRGGLGAANEFLRHGGQVLVNSKSLNFEVFDNFPGLQVVSINNDFKYFDHLMDDRVNDVAQYFDKNRASAKLAFDKAKSEYHKAYNEIYG